MQRNDLRTNADFNRIMEVALTDYQLWFDETEPDDKLIIDTIADSLSRQDYWHCDYLEDALAAWQNNLTDLVSGTTNQDDIQNANNQLALLDIYFS